MTFQTSKGVDLEFGSGNVFADLNLPDAEKLDLRSALVIEITRLVKQQGLTPAQLAKRLAIAESQVTALLHGNFAALSECMLLEYVNRLGYDVELVLRPSAAPVGCMRLA